jgi:hypothetical protein
MTNNLQQPTLEEIGAAMCDHCNAIVCAGCPIYEGLKKHAPCESADVQRGYFVVDVFGMRKK